MLKPGDGQAMKATGFLVAGIHNTVVPPNETAKAIAFQDELEDLVSAVGQTFLGLTVNCGRCHDHKFDPISTKDYYRMASALSGVRHGERTVVSPSAEKELAKLQAEIASLTTRLGKIEEPIRQAILTEKKTDKKPGPAPPALLAAWDFRDSGKDRVGKLDVKLFGEARLTAAGLVVDGKTGFARTAPLTRDLKEKTLEVWVRLDNLDQKGGGASLFRPSTA